jgi:hypothetical protein
MAEDWFDKKAPKRSECKQYSFHFNEERQAMEVRPKFYPLREPMYYDNAQLTFAAMVEHESDAFEMLDDGAEARVHYEAHRIQIWPAMETDTAFVLQPVILPRSPAGYRQSLLIDLLVPSDRAQDMHANLADLYPKWVQRHGERKAAWVARMQIAMLIGGNGWEKLAPIFDKLLKIVRLIGF